ncbi:enoyl-CoA hydratase/isomerase family protein [Imbroritus primus]|uniref:enoyl-CoA hydratase/isomerase family protein n=1 Tax=Imbroritus primus TaxID=3058603 RepID=UPI003D162260
MSHAPTVLLEKADGIAVLTLNRPDKLNAMSAAMRAEFGAHLQAIAADPEIRIVLLQGLGRAFCVGADTSDLPTTPLGWRDRILTAQLHHIALIKMSKIVIASVQGVAAGGGASLALAADILVMADDATLRFPFVRLGLIPDGGCSYLLQSKLGVPAALDLMLTGGTMDAEEARRMGLTRRVVPAARLQETTRALADELLALPQEALLLTKSVSRQTWTNTMEAALGHEADAFALATVMPGHQRALAAAQARLKNKGDH